VSPSLRKKNRVTHTHSKEKRREAALAAAPRQSEPERKEPFIDFRSP